MKKTELLIELVKQTNNIEKLTKFGRDSNEELYIVTKDDIKNLINRFLLKEIDSKFIEEWSNTIEGRDDLGFESDIDEIIYELANPVLYGGDINEKRAKEIVKDFKL